MRNLRLSPAVRIGIVLSGAWLLCDIARGWSVSYDAGADNITESFAVFWGKIATALDPWAWWLLSSPPDWLVKLIALSVLFLLPTILWWIVRPLAARYSSSLTARGSFGIPKN